MKKLFLLFIFFLLAINMKAQTSTEKQVDEALEKLRTAMISGDKNALETIASNELTYGHSSGKLEDKASFVESITSKKSDFVTITFTDKTAKIKGKTAVVRLKLAADTNDGGKPGKVNLALLLVFQKENGSWKMWARQAVKI